LPFPDLLKETSWFYKKTTNEFFVHCYNSLFIVLSVQSCRNSEITEDKKCTSLSKNEDKTMFAGTYTKKEGHVDGQADGIITLKIVPGSGEIISQHLLVEVVNTSFVKGFPKMTNF
jgi:hypothetical protein